MVPDEAGAVSPLGETTCHAPREVSGERSRSNGVPQAAIPDDVIRLYSAIPTKIQELINEAGLEARDRGESMELRVSELVSLTHLTHDDVHYAKLLSMRGEPASSIVKTMLMRAEHLVQHPQSVVASLSPSPVTRRVGSASTGRVAPSQEPGGYSGRPHSIVPPESSRRTRSPGRRSNTPKNPTRAYANAALEFQAVRHLAKDRTAPGPDAARFGINIRPIAASSSPAPETLRRSEIIGKADPNSILGKLLKSSNSAGGIRSRSPRMPSPREPVTMQSYIVPGMAEQVKARNKNSRHQAAFGSSSTNASYLPRDVQQALGAQKRQTRKAKLTAAAQQDAAALLKSARSVRNASPGPTPRGGSGGLTPRPMKKDTATPRTNKQAPRAGPAMPN